jgi:hypothetical protein
MVSRRVVLNNSDEPAKRERKTSASNSDVEKCRVRKNLTHAVAADRLSRAHYFSQLTVTAEYFFFF